MSVGAAGMEVCTTGMEMHKRGVEARRKILEDALTTSDTMPKQFCWRSRSHHLRRRRNRATKGRRATTPRKDPPPHPCSPSRPPHQIGCTLRTPRTFASGRRSST
eukprot:scaffold907_cov247-Pinguiococcus_pyrenoidosus.AAC.5